MARKISKPFQEGWNRGMEIQASHWDEPAQGWIPPEYPENFKSGLIDLGPEQLTVIDTFDLLYDRRRINSALQQRVNLYPDDAFSRDAKNSLREIDAELAKRKATGANFDWPEPREIHELGPREYVHETVAARQELSDAGISDRIASRQYLSGSDDPGKSLSSASQSEPLTDFLDRYVPDWRNLSPSERGAELINLHKKFQFHLIGDIVYHPEWELVELEDEHEEMIGKGPDTFNAVGYYPAGTAAYEDYSLTHKDYGQQAYPVSIKVQVTWPDGSSLVDDIKGLNKGHALFRAKENWPDASEIKFLRFTDAGTAAFAEPQSYKVSPGLYQEIMSLEYWTIDPNDSPPDHRHFGEQWAASNPVVLDNQSKRYYLQQLENWIDLWSQNQAQGVAFTRAANNLANRIRGIASFDDISTGINYDTLLAAIREAQDHLSGLQRPNIRSAKAALAHLINLGLEYPADEHMAEVISDYEHNPGEETWEDIVATFGDLYHFTKIQERRAEAQSISDEDEEFYSNFTDTKPKSAQDAGVKFIRMQPNDDAVDALLETVRKWESQATAIIAATTTPRTALRAQFAADTAFVAAKTLQAGKCCVIAAYTSTAIVGIAVYRLYPDHSALIDLVSVMPDLQPGSPKANIRGIGTGLVCTIGAYLIEDNVHRVCLRPLDQDAKDFWLKRGFKTERDQLCIVDNIPVLLNACEAHEECPDQGEECMIGNEGQVAEFRKPTVRRQLAKYGVPGG